MKRSFFTACTLPASALVLALFCASPQNPFTDPKSAGIVADSSLTSLTDSVSAFSTVPCTVSVYLPDLIDSFFVSRKIGSQAGTTIASGTVTASKIAFSLPVDYPGEYIITVRIVKTDKTGDTLTKTITVYSPYSMQLSIVLPQKDSLLYHQTYACSCVVSHPELADSVYARLITASSDTLLVLAKASAGFGFSFTVPVIGTFSVRVTGTLLGGGRDSVTKTCIGYVPYLTHVNFVLPQNDSLRYNREYACSCSVSHPEFADSMQAHLIYGSTDTVLVRTRAAAGLRFRFTVPTVGAFSIRATVTLLGGGSDSVTKDLIGYVLTPVVTPDSAAYHVILPLGSFTFRFTAVGPDSNLRVGYTWLDTAVEQTQATPFLPLKPYHEVFSRTVDSAALLAALGAPIVCHAYAIDADSLISAMASCTLFVTDTTKPGIRLLTPNPADTIRTLPVSVKAIVTDLSGIEAVTFNGASMVLSHDTASYEASSIDSGKSLDSIIALDRLGSRSALVFHLNYTGKKLYPPKIIDLSRATTEGHPFASISLDASVTLTDTSITNPAPYKRDSLTWVITDSLGNQIAVPVSHVISIPFPSDTEWTGTIKLTFRVTVKNNPSLYDTKQPSFFVAEVYDPPVITFPQSLCSTTPKSGEFFLDTITTVRALDNKLSTLNWTFKNGKHFKVDSVYSLKVSGLPKAAADLANPIDGKDITPIFGFFNRHIRISNIATADTGYIGTDTLQFTVISPQGPPVSKSIYFTHAKICIIRLLN
jgi:hypothetical protein